MSTAPSTATRVIAASAAAAAWVQARWRRAKRWTFKNKGSRKAEVGSSARKCSTSWARCCAEG